MRILGAIPSPGTHLGQGFDKLNHQSVRVSRPPLWDGKVGGDSAVAERLVGYERARASRSTCKGWLQSAIQRWDQDHKV